MRVEVTVLLYQEVGRVFDINERKPSGSQHSRLPAMALASGYSKSHLVYFSGPRLYSKNFFEHSILSFP
jgi:hypothetical protein